MTDNKDAEIERLKAYIEGQDDSFSAMMEGVKTRNAEIERLNALVAMQAEALMALDDDSQMGRNSTLSCGHGWPCGCSHTNALKVLSATAETVSAWQSKRDNEIRANERHATLSEVVGLSHDFSDRQGNIFSSDFRSLLNSMASELRAKGE